MLHSASSPSPYYKPLKYKVINKINKRVVFRDYTYDQAVQVCKEFKHLAFVSQ